MLPSIFYVECGLDVSYTAVLICAGCCFQLENADLCDKIHQERQICIAVKVQNRMIQQKNLELSGYGVDDQFF